jgi:hypothetical protein
MADGKAEKLLSEVGPGDFPSPTEAGHNAEGMYTMRDSKPGEFNNEQVIELESGLFVDRSFMPNWKEYRILWIDTQSGHFQIECDESYESIKDTLAHAISEDASPYYTFTDPTYGHKNEVPRGALQHPIAIVTGLRDLKQIEDQLKELEKQKSLMRLQNASKDRSAAIVDQYNRKRQN